MKDKTLSRRDFMGAAAAIGAFTVVPRHVLGGAGNTPPSEKLNIAGIGAGGQGASDLRHMESENIVALCDVDWRRARGMFNRHPDARKYRDFREMLDKEDDKVDAVVVAIPDHMHAAASMVAIKRGKHVYCEKPLTHDVYEARVLAEAAGKAGVATQMGNQGQASEETRLMCETIWDGAIGEVREVHVWTDRPLRGINDVYWPQGVKRPEETPPVPDEVAWDLWLGTAPERPYHPDYMPFRWRGWWDFGTGALGDIGCHRIDPIFRALKLGHPTSVEACCTLVNDETYPVASRVTYGFPAREGMAPVTLHWYDGGMKPPRPKELEDGRKWDTNGILFVGDEGTMYETRLLPESRQRAYGKPPQMIERSPGHYVEWIQACKGGKPAGSNFPDHAGLLAQVVLLGNLALRSSLKEKVTRARLMWDGEAMKVTNMPEANEFLRRTYRQGWTL
ncbi:MAG: Gfo/Idh/MocA family oxidoreductase [Phycisphaerales bacterium]|nr:MAG: Gfo/Idh/MocA family oxidoreductase [Phycisphaerales bacterium]